MKTCTKCKELKPLVEFYKYKRTKDGLQSSCKECMRKQKRGAYQLLEVKLRKKEYYQNRDRDKLRAYWRERDRKLRKTSKFYVLNSRMRTLIYQEIRGGKRRKSWKEFIDYNLNDLMRHLESKFTKGMTWEKFMNGEIHIDHILPLSFFNYTSADDAEFRKCWSLENLQPLWAEDNMKKHNKVSLKLTG